MPHRTRELGYAVVEMPALRVTPAMTFKRQNRENGRPGLENGSRGRKNSSGDINSTFPGITAKCPAAEK